MLIEKILDGLTAIIEFIAKVLVFLLKALGLWIPVLYSLLFVIVMSIFKIPFESVNALFFVGLVVSVLFAFYLMCMRVIDRKNRRYLDKKKKRANALVKKQEKLREREERIQEREERARIKKERAKQKRSDSYSNPLPPEYPLQPQNESAPTQNQSVRIEDKATESYTAQPTLVSPLQNQTSPTIDRGYENMNGYRPTQAPYNPPPQRAEDIIAKPKIFRTRMDPDMLIFEYPDRLVFYRKTQSGLEHVRTERKPST